MTMPSLVGQDGEIAGAGQGARQALEHGPGGLDQGLVGFDHPVPGLRRNQVESQRAVGPLAAGEAAAP